MWDVLVHGGLVATPARVERADIAVSDGKIAAVSPDLSGKARRVVDASGKLVLPGIIDVHAHPVYADDLASLPVTAAHGGVTTVIHYAYAKPGTGLVRAIHDFRRTGERESILDFALHGGLFDPKAQAQEIPEAVAAGITSFKMFMTYAKLGWMTDDYQLMRTLDLLGQAGGMGMVHAENGLATDYLEDKYLALGCDPAEAFVATRPAILEAEAIHRAIAMAQVAGCPLYIPHMSAALGVEVVARARENGHRVYAETCPQYLTLTGEEVFRQGPLVKIGPPLRDEADRRALWRGLSEGVLDVVASDHAAKEKRRTEDFFQAAYGTPQVETMLPLVFDGGVHGGWLSVSRLVQVMCENPARIFGLYPRKGTLAVGSDADLVVFDPTARHTITRDTQHSQVSYTVYEGRPCLGRVVFSMQRGEPLVAEGRLEAKLGRGEFLATCAGRVPIEELHRRG